MPSAPRAVGWSPTGTGVRLAMTLDFEPGESLPPDATEADVVEQRLPITSEDEHPEPLRLDAEVPEADALDQALEAPSDSESYETT